MAANSRLRTRIVPGLALACLAMVVMLNGKPAFTNAAKPLRGIGDPALAMQVVRNVKEVDAILSDAPSPDREAMRIKQYVDFGFIACYAALFVGLGRMFATRTAYVGTALGICAALCDVIENNGILRILDVPLAQVTPSMIVAIRYPSLAKWTDTWIALAIFAWLFWRAGGWLRQAVGVAFGLAAVVGVGGLFENALLFWAGIPMGLGLVGIALTAIL